MKIKIFTLLVCSGVFYANAFSQAINAQDSLALVDLYNHTNGPGWKHHNNWLTAKPVSNWYGITVAGARVTQIDLQINRLSGTIPASIANITELFNLILSDNKLTGTIPPEIGNLKKLYGLYLFYNHLSGNIPPELGNLAGIWQLDLFHNQLTGDIPASFGNLAATIQYLDLSENKLNGSIPAALGNLVNLQQLALHKNQLTGSIPLALTSLPNVYTLTLNNNQLSGSIPPEISQLANLSILNLSFNHFSGTLPSSLGSLTKLTDLFLSHNQLSSTIPAQLGNLTNIRTLDVSYNQLSGALPSSLSNLIFMSSINISHNKLTGHITNAISNLKTLYGLIADHNRLSGNIAEAIATLPLETLSLSNNHFTFAGMELVAKTFPFAQYDNQKLIAIHESSDGLSVSAGGTLSNNTYNWFKVGTAGSTTVTGDSTFHPTQSGLYYAKVTNAVATQLTLPSDTVEYVANTLLTRNANTSVADKTASFSIYPNPAKDRITIQHSGKAVFTLTSQQGKTIITKTIANTGFMNVNKLPAGVYYLTNIATGASQKIVVGR